MARFSLLALALSYLAAPSAQAFQERTLSVGANATEAMMTFDFRVTFSSDDQPTAEEAKGKIEDQVQHLFGPMGEARVKAVPAGEHTITQVKEVSHRGGKYTYSYHYEGKIVLENGPNDKYAVVLPMNPETIYEAGIVKRFNRKSYPCTDSHYNSEGDFWYFWNPAKAGCPLREGRDYASIETKIKRFKNTTLTFPEYNRLAQDGVIRIDVLMGMDKPEQNRNPLVSRDENAQNYRGIRNTLKQMGFADRKWSDKEIREIANVQGEKLPWVEEFRKDGKKAQLVVRLFFGPTGIDEESTAFHFFFKDALEHAPVMVYDGHSGLGGHLDIGEIEKSHDFKIDITGNHYQMYFFNSCSSYTYYRKMFFERKKTAQDPKGTKQLDILSNGLATYFYVMHDTNIALVRAIDLWNGNGAPLSFQALAKQIDSKNLFMVNGDEDNPTNPNAVR